MFLCLKLRLKRGNVWFWRSKPRFKHRNANRFGVFDIYASRADAEEPHPSARPFYRVKGALKSSPLARTQSWPVPSVPAWSNSALHFSVAGLQLAPFAAGCDTFTWVAADSHRLS